MNLKVGLQVMITSNIDINDMLINGLLGRVTQFNVLFLVLFMFNLMMTVQVKGNEVRSNS